MDKEEPNEYTKKRDELIKEIGQFTEEEVDCLIEQAKFMKYRKWQTQLTVTNHVLEEFNETGISSWNTLASLIKKSDIIAGPSGGYKKRNHVISWLSNEYKINPDTSEKAIRILISQGLLKESWYHNIR